MKQFEFSLNKPAPKQVIISKLEKLFKLPNKFSIITSDKTLVSRSIQEVFKKYSDESVTGRKHQHVGDRRLS